MGQVSRVFSILPKRTIWRSTIVLVALALFTSTALAVQNVTGRVVGTGLGQRVTFGKPGPGGGNVTDFAGEILLQLDNGSPSPAKTFCIDLNISVNPAARPPYQDGGAVAPCQIGYLIASYKANPNKSNLLAAATQLAIWHYTNQVDMTTIQDPAVRALAAQLVSQADQNPCPIPRSTVPQLAINPPTATVGPGQPQTYTIQVTPANSASSVTLQINGTATFQGGAQQITVPLSGGTASVTVINGPNGPSTIDASISFVLDPGTRFISPPNANQTQPIVLVDAVSSTQSAQATLQVGQTATETPTNTPTETPTSTPTNTPGGPTATPTSTPTATPTKTPGGPTETPTSTPTVGTTTPTPQEFPSPTPTQPVIQPTSTPKKGNKSTPTPTETSGSPTETPSGPNETPTSPDLTPGGPAETPTSPDLTPGGPAGGVTDSNQAVAGGATRPARLPNTGEQAGPDYRGLLIAGALLCAGLLMRRRTRRAR